MTKEQFIIDTLFLLYRKPRVTLKEMSHNDYGISRATAWRVLRNLREAGVVKEDWSLTEEFRARLKDLTCKACPLPKIVEQHHTEQSKKMLAKSLDP